MVDVRPVRGVVALLAVGALACGCSGGGAGSRGTPSVDPYEVAASAQAQRASASASVQASRDAALGPDLVAKRDAALAMEAPEKPAEFSEDSPSGARAAAIYFTRLYRYSAVTGDTKEFKAMSEGQCTFCSDVLKKVDNLHKDGGWADPWTQTIEDVAVFEINPGYEHRRVDVTISSGGTTSYSGDGSKTYPTEAENSQLFRVALRYSGSGWTVGEAEVIEQ